MTPKLPSKVKSRVGIPGGLVAMMIPPCEHSRASAPSLSVVLEAPCVAIMRCDYTAPYRKSRALSLRQDRAFLFRVPCRDPRARHQSPLRRLVNRGAARGRVPQYA